MARSASPANEAVLRRLREGMGFDGLASTGDGSGIRNSHPSPTDAEGVDRQISVRSIMTLPAYTASARPTEKILGREGERAGMDVVVEFPESTTEEEARREEEMESLYQIREARREQQAARRQERNLRRARREARNLGDRRAVAELDAQAARARESAASRPNVLMAEHQTRDRERGRRISSVAYASLGVARHDGSRVRSDSASEDGRPLLDSAAGMGSRDVSRGESPASFDQRLCAESYTLPPQCGRDRNISTSSLAHFITPDPNSDAADSDRSSGDFEAPTPFSNSRSRSGSAACAEVDVQGRSRAASARPSSGLRIDSTDLGAHSLSHHWQSTSCNAVLGSEDAEMRALPPDYDNLSPIQEQRLEPEREHEREQQHRNLVDMDTSVGAEAQNQNTDPGILALQRSDAPPYESPVRDVHDPAYLASFSRLPSIRVTPFSPFAGDREMNGEFT